MTYHVGHSIRFSNNVEEDKPQRLWDVGTRIVFVKFANTVSLPFPVLAR